MGQTVPTQVQNQIDAEQSRPILLVEIGLNVGTLRFASTRSNVIFPTGGNTYTAKSFSVGNIKQTKEGQIINVEFVFDNVGSDMYAYNVAEKFDGKTIILKKVYQDALGDSSYYREILNGFMEEPHSIDKRWLKVNGVMGKSLQRRVLQEYFQRLCNNDFGDEKCDYEGNADLTSLTYTGNIDSGATNYIIDNALTQADDYWNFGRIEINEGGVTYFRKIEDFIASSDKVIFDVPFVFSISSGATYTIYKGCSKTLLSCRSEYSYGPSSDNDDNFNGWIHIGDEN